MNNYTDHVTSLLQNYRTTKRKIEQLRSELEHPTRVTPEAIRWTEMLPLEIFAFLERKNSFSVKERSFLFLRMK